MLTLKYILHLGYLYRFGTPYLKKVDWLQRDDTPIILWRWQLTHYVHDMSNHLNHK